MKTILAFLLATALFTAASRADVVIYRGVQTTTSDVTSSTQFGKTVNVYFVVDYANAQFGSVIFGRINGVGKRFIEGTATTANFGSAPLPKGHTASFVISTGKNDTSPTVFSDFSLFFRGTDKTLLIQKTPSPVIINRPTALKGVAVIGTRNGSTGVFGDERFGLTFQGAASIKANNAGQTIKQALDGFASALITKGYTEQ